MRTNVFRNILASLALLVVLAACDTRNARVLSPEANGLTCTSATICIEDPARLPEAQALYAEAATFVQTRISPFRTPPRVLFCSTESCFAQFTDPAPRAVNLGTFGIVIGPRGWLDYTVRHEMIHHVQNERFGVLRASNRLPRWFIEGMAYSLSGDPRRPLPRPELEDWRTRFDTWIAAGNQWTDPPG